MTTSILICVHSRDDAHDKMFLEALDSLQHQTYKDFDVFIVFDECWENTIGKIKDVYDFNVTRLFHEKKQGLSFAKNFGLQYINSEWVGFLDADDLYMPKKLEKQSKFIENHSDVDFIGSQALNRFPGSNQFFDSCFKTGQYETHEDLIKILFKENVLTHGSMLIKKSCLDDLGGYNNVKGQEDWDLWKRSINKGYKFYQLQDRLYVYTIGTSVER